MPYRVLLTDDAAEDLENLFDYLAVHDSPVRALQVLDGIEQVLAALADFLERGVYPPELVAVGVREYREVFFKPYRVIYRLIGDAVYVALIADGRRNRQALLFTFAG
jgi:toxin ParE1/3/4